MKQSKFLITFLVVPMLILGACSGKPVVLNLTGQSPQVAPVAQVVTATPQAAVQPVVQKDAPAAVQAPAVTGDVATLQSALEAVYQKVNPSVVSIEVVEQTAAAPSNGRRTPQNPFGGNATPAMALGSGFVWDKLGHIVTNNHVVDGASTITVTFADGTTADAKLVGADPNADLAVIKVEVDASLLVPIQVGDSTQVKVGELAIAIGNPYGLANTMTQGIISALSRSMPGGSSSQNLQSGLTYSIPDIIQTDASINPGNSGGVLVDIEGQLLGVTFAIESSSQASAGIGFVIPSEIVNKVVPPIIATGKFDHPYLGITGTTLVPALAKAMNLDPKQEGALVAEVAAGGPAEKTGLLGSTQTVTIDGQDVAVGGDIIIAINGQTINHFDELVSYVFIHTNAGDTVTLTVLRQGKEIKLPLTIGAIPTP
jgi:serine protease Do